MKGGDRDYQGHLAPVFFQSLSPTHTHQHTHKHANNIEMLSRGWKIDIAAAGPCITANLWACADNLHTGMLPCAGI